VTSRLAAHRSAHVAATLGMLSFAAGGVVLVTGSVELAFAVAATILMVALSGAVVASVRRAV
jgi:hypothetical protein